VYSAGRPMSERPHWKLIPRFLLRRAGFPFGLLETFAAPEALAQGRVASDRRQEARRWREELLRRHFPHEVRVAHRDGNRQHLRALSRWRKRVGRERVGPVPGGAWSPALLDAHQQWSDAVGAATKAHRGVHEALGRELRAARIALRRFFRRPDAREALFLLSPALLETMEKVLDRDPSEVADADERAFERRLYAFAQRLSAKNETTSFFGPLAYGQVEGVPETVLGPERPGGVSRREAFLSFWAAAALGKAASQDPEVRPGLAVRRIPAAAMRQGRALSATGKEVALPPELVALFEAVDDGSGAAVLAERVGRAPALVEREVAALERLGFVRRDIEPLSTVSHPLADVIRQLPGTPAGRRWQALGNQLTLLLRRFEEADLAGRRKLMAEAEELFTAGTGQPARRAAGEIYADRTILYEDCLGDLQPVRMSREDAARLERSLSPVLELGARYGLLRHQAICSLARNTADALPLPVSFLEFSAAMEARLEKKELVPLRAAASEWLEALHRTVAQASDGRVARLSSSDLADLVDGPATGRFASPDVMLRRGADGRLSYVIGEVHPYVFAWGSQNQFAPDFDALQATFAEDLSPWNGPDQLAVVLRRRRHKGLVSHAFPGRFIEVTGRASHDRRRCIAVADLVVVAGDDGPRLKGPHGPLTLYTGEDDHPHLRAFSIPAVEMPPIRLGAHTPRIELGDVIVQRERWSIASGGLQPLVSAGDTARLALAVAEAQRAHGWPRHVFVSSPSEGKPICLDLAATFSHALLQRLASLGPLEVVEMMPGPEELWLRRTGEGHTSELRMAMVRTP
jgi:hypothetical protein